VLALFVLGARGVPSALVRANARSERADTLARDIGQSLVPLVGRRGFSYVQRMPDSSWVLKTARVSQRESSAAVEVVATLPSGADYVAWLSTDMVLSASGGKVLVYATKSKSWAEVADLSAAGLTRISRLAVSPDGRWLALVAAE